MKPALANSPGVRAPLQFWNVAQRFWTDLKSFESRITRELPSPTEDRGRILLIVDTDSIMFKLRDSIGTSYSKGTQVQA